MASPVSPAPVSGGDSTGWKVIVATAVGFTIATTAIILRLVSRWLCKKRLEANDYLIILGYISKLGIDIGSVLLVCYGIGRNITEISPFDLVSYLKVLYIGPLFYGLCIGFVKLSILALYWSAFKVKYMRYSVYGLGTIVACWTIAVVVVALASCDPVSKSWHPLEPGKCINYKQYYYGAQIPNVITDFAILIMPLKAVWDLDLATKQRIYMSAVLCLALVTCSFDIVRLVVLVNLDNAGNFTKNQVGLSIWTNLEPSMAILIACLPICRPLLAPRSFMQLRNQSPAPADYDLDHDDQSPSRSKEDYYERSDEISSDGSPSRNL